jgi:hypothetical protein
MATRKQRTAARKNIRKAAAKWRGMTKRQRALAQPQGRARRTRGAGGGAFYRIEVRPKGEFTSFRTQDVGKKGGLERLAGRRSSGSWATATWLVSKKHAHVRGGRLIIDNAKERASLAKAIRGPVTQVKGDVFRAHPAKNVPERAKPTPAMQRAQRANIRKAQTARRTSR